MKPDPAGPDQRRSRNPEASSAFHLGPARRGPAGWWLGPRSTPCLRAWAASPLEGPKPCALRACLAACGGFGKSEPRLRCFESPIASDPRARHVSGFCYATTSLRKNQRGFNFSVCGYIYADAAPGDRYLHGALRQTRHLLFRPDELTEVTAIEK